MDPSNARSGALGTGLEPPAQDESEMGERYLPFDKTCGLWKDCQAHFWRFVKNQTHKLPNCPKSIAILAPAVARDYPITHMILARSTRVNSSHSKA
ncbi:unnamed protein product [Clonostachys byssicola]|uniref:Uncharacterized protein n=1 Tax=Clonostachys byssicola TaxID=160290 RepID=A0A9N9YB95_9HYPO|nr:unnamed protein product [Clonostachys byssicola]